MAERMVKFKPLKSSLGLPRWLRLCFFMVFTACKVGGTVSTDVSENVSTTLTPIVNAPTITTPANNPFYSNLSSLTLQGMCLVGSTVNLSGDSTQSMPCGIDSTYQFTDIKNSDGVYIYQIRQKDSIGNISASVTSVWIRKSTSTAPTILTPAVQPYLSTKSSVTITGACESGATLTLSGAASGSTTCVASAYSFTIPKSIDGDYTFTITSVDLAGNSSSNALVWKKHVIAASPPHPTVTVKTPQVFALTGGSGHFTLTVPTNLSVGTVNSATSTYTPGTLAGVIDHVLATDDYGDTVDIPVTTTRDVADHLVLVSGDTQSASIGSLLSLPLRVQVVDQYANGIPSYPLLFTRIYGDASLLSSEIQISDSTGFAQVSVQAGYTYLNSKFHVAALSQALPDNAASGNPSLNFTTTATATGKNTFGLHFKVGTSPAALLLGKFSPSSFGDIIVINAGSNSAGILTGLGNGLFADMLPINLGSCQSPGAVVSGDFNGDGYLDLAVLCTANNKISILLNHCNGNCNGSTQFQTASLITTDDSPSALTVADYDGDGLLDFAVASTLNNEISFHLGNGSGGFQAFTSFIISTASSVPSALANLKLGSDTKTDLVMANLATGKIATIKNNSTSGNINFGNYTEYNSGSGLNSGVNSVSVYDLDQDGFQDVLTTNGSDGSASIFYGNAGGNLTTSSAILVGTNPTATTIADTNGDAIPDFVVLNAGDNTLSVITGNGSRSFSNSQTVVSSLNSMTALTSFDVNGDLQNDFFAVGSGTFNNITNFFVQEWIGSASGNLQPTTALGTDITPALNPTAGVAADFTGDGKIDVAVVNQGSGSVSILKGAGNGNFSLVNTLNTGNSSNPVAIATADFRQNGKKDLVVVNQGNNSIGVFLGNADSGGTFATRVDYSTAANPTGVVIGDFDHDGFLDIAVSEGSSNKVSVFYGDGTGSFNVNRTRADYSTLDTLNSGAGPVGIVSADFNNDGIIDLATVNSDNTISVLIGNANGTFAQAQTYALDQNAGPVALIAADLNHDGKMDLISVNNQSGSINIFLGIGDGSFRTAITVSVGATPTGIVAGNFSGIANHTDLMLTLGSQNATLMLPYVSSTTSNVIFGSTINNSASGTNNELGTLNSLIAIDVNQDGILDLIYLDGTNNQIITRLGQ